MAVERLCWNVVGPPEWECEAMDSVVWVQCTNLCRVYINLSIAAPADKGPGQEKVTPCINSNKNNVLNNNEISWVVIAVRNPCHVLVGL